MTYAIDLFCGIGGLTKGLSLSGINVVAGIDNDITCQFAYETNNSARFICKDIDKIHGYELKKYYLEKGTRVLVGCAPCQPFSKYSSKYRKNGQRDNKWKLLYSFERLVREVQPDIVSIENVPNLLKEKVFSDFKKSLEEMNYNIWNGIIFCPDYGVPQNRRRLVLLASKFGPIKFIDPIYTDTNYKTVRDTIANLPPLNAGQVSADDPLHCASALSKMNLERIHESKPGGTWRDWNEELKVACHNKESGKTYPSVYGRMEWDKPSPTITTQFYGYGNGRFGHPEQDRALSLREGAMLQSFPEDYIFIDEEHPASKKQLGTHIGNAVPVALGKAIGTSIQRHIEEISHA